MIEKSNDKFDSQLDIENLLNHLRDSENILKALKGRDQKMMLRFAKNRVINIDDSDSSSDDSRFQLDSEMSQKIEKPSYDNPMKNIVAQQLKKQVKVKSELFEGFDLEMAKIKDSIEKPINQFPNEIIDLTSVKPNSSDNRLSHLDLTDHKFDLAGQPDDQV